MDLYYCYYLIIISVFILNNFKTKEKKKMVKYCLVDASVISFINIQCCYRYYAKIVTELASLWAVFV